MAASRSTEPAHLYVGIKGCVVALKRSNGDIAWSAKLPRSSSIVPTVVEGGHVFAISGGEVSCLDARTGRLVWHNPLKGYGLGPGLLAGAQDGGAAAAAEAAAAAAAAAAASASAAASAASTS